MSAEDRRTPILVVTAACAALLALCALTPVAAQPAGDTAGKPVAPFSVEADVLGPVAIGVPVDVGISVSSRTPLDDVEVRVSPDSTLSVEPGDLVLHAASASPDEPAEWRITVVPLAEGAHRLRLFGEAVVGGVRQARSTVATIRVGTGNAVERASTTRAAGREQNGATPPPKPRTDEAKAPADTADDRVIRLPAVVRP